MFMLKTKAYGATHMISYMHNRDNEMATFIGK